MPLYGPGAHARQAERARFCAYTAQKVAELRGMDAEEFALAAYENGKRLVWHLRRAKRLEILQRNAHGSTAVRISRFWRHKFALCGEMKHSWRIDTRKSYELRLLVPGLRIDMGEGQVYTDFTQKPSRHARGEAAMQHMNSSRLAIRRTNFKAQFCRNWQLLVIDIRIGVLSAVPLWPDVWCGDRVSEFSARKGILGSDWEGLKHFQNFLLDPYFYKLVRNTLALNVLTLLFGFPAPILFALLLNEIRANGYKRFVQTVSYLPHFISSVVLCGMIVKFCEIKGLINDIVELFGAERIGFLQDPRYFRTIFVLQHIWKSLGWNAIIYIAALTGISPDLYECADLEGANRLQKILHITLPGISPTIIIMLILRIGTS